MHTVVIDGHDASIVRPHSADSFSIFVVGCSTGNLTLENVNVRDGGGAAAIDGGAIDVTTATPRSRSTAAPSATTTPITETTAEAAPSTT